MKLGFMNPDGKFYECEYYGHLDLAEEICEHTGIINELRSLSSLNKYINRLTCEDFLIAKGYLAVYSRGVGHSCKHMRGTQVMDKVFPRVHLSEKQKIFLKDNLENAWNSDMCEAMNRILEYDEYESE